MLLFYRKKKQGEILLLLICLSGVLVSGCIPIEADAPTLSPCTPGDPQANVYRSFSIQPQAAGIYQIAAATKNMNDPLYRTAQAQAVEWLENETQDWSSKVDFLNQEGNQGVRIVVTFLSPELLQAVILNESLRSLRVTDTFDNVLRNSLDRIASRNELLFLVTITSSQPTVPGQASLLQFPVKKLTLTNTAAISIAAGHYDPVLNNPINLSSGPISAMVAFPIAVEKNGQCIWLFDPKWTTSLTLSVPSITLDGRSFSYSTWPIDYIPPLQAGNEISPASFFTDTLTADPLKYTPLNTPPSPFWNAPESDQTYWMQYWQDMGRFIWSQLYYLQN